MSYLIGFFLVMHGLVHLFYFAHIQKHLILHPTAEGHGLLPGHSILHSTRLPTALACVITAAGFTIAGGGVAGVAVFEPWWVEAGILSAVFSSLLFFIWYNGRLENMDEPAAYAMNINLLILAVLIIYP